MPPSPLSQQIGIDTTGNHLMIGFFHKGTCSFSVNLPINSQRTHSALLIPTLQEGLNTMGWEMADITSFALNLGPGSFTGIRTGVTTTRTLAQFLAIPIFPFTTFQCLALAAREKNPKENTWSLYLDARRGQAYHTLIQIDDTQKLHQQEPKLVQLDTHHPPEGMPCLISPTLKEWLQPLQLPQWETLSPHITDVPTPFTPAVMAQWLHQQSHPVDYFHEHAVPWKHVLPLYIQQPNVTLKRRPKIPLQ